MTAIQKVEAVIKQLPRQLDADHGFEFVFELHRLQSAINRLNKQAWLLEVDQWLRQDAPDGLYFKVVYEKSDGYYLEDDSIDGVEDESDATQAIEELLDGLAQLETNDSDWCGKVVSSLNRARWNGNQARAVLAAWAEGMGIEKGMAWMDGIVAEEQRRALEANTPGATAAKPKGTRL